MCLLSPVDDLSDSGLYLLSQEVPLRAEVLGCSHEALDHNNSIIRADIQISSLLSPFTTSSYLYPLLVSIHNLLQSLQRLQQSTNRLQVRSTVLNGQLLLHRPHPLLHVLQGALEL